jgi:hypothetical protein
MTAPHPAPGNRRHPPSGPTRLYVATGRPSPERPDRDENVAVTAIVMA